MSQLIYLFLLFILASSPQVSLGQCQSLALIDSSFEFSVFHGYSGIPETGKWFYDDGVILSSDGYTGNQSACSNGGGGFQFIDVDSNTTYFVSAYILNGVNEPAPYPHFRINWTPHPVSVSSNDWTFISTSFDSGSDSLAIIGFYSLGACFDEFRITCNPLTSLEVPEDLRKPYILQSNRSNTHYQLLAKKELKLEIRTISGQLLEQLQAGPEILFGASLPQGLYFLTIKTSFGTWGEKLIKL